MQPENGWMQNFSCFLNYMLGNDPCMLEDVQLHCLKCLCNEILKPDFFMLIYNPHCPDYYARNRI